MSIGGNTPEYANGTARFTNTTVSNNVLVEIGRSRPTNRTLSWGVSAPLFKTRCAVVVGHGLEVDTIAVFTTSHSVTLSNHFNVSKLLLMCASSRSLAYIFGALPTHTHTIPCLHMWCITHTLLPLIFELAVGCFRLARRCYYKQFVSQCDRAYGAEHVRTRVSRISSRRGDLVQHRVQPSQ